MYKQYLLASSFCVKDQTNLLFVLVNFTKSLYIETLFKVMFVQDSGFDQVSVYSSFTVYTCLLIKFDLLAIV